MTQKRDGRPQLSPVSGIDGEGRVVVATYPQRAKVVNARREPQVTLCFLSDDWDGPRVQVEGTAEVLDLPHALDAFVEYYGSIAGEQRDWDDYRAAMVRQGTDACADRASLSFVLTPVIHVLALTVGAWLALRRATGGTRALLLVALAVAAPVLSLGTAILLVSRG
jgi:PPOX class probable F420-dependent enzyme